LSPLPHIRNQTKEDETGGAFSKHRKDKIMQHTGRKYLNKGTTGKTKS